MKLPPALQRNLTGAELSVVSWSAASEELVLRLELPAATEPAVLRFRGVLQVSLPPNLVIEGFEVHTAASAPGDFWGPATPVKGELGDTDRIVLIFGAWGGRFFVVAEELAVEALA
jgi:hypothetical protein